MYKVNCDTKLCFGIMVLCFLNIVIGILLSSNIARAESRTVNAAVTVPEACTMTSTNTAPHTATLSPNTYSGASGSEYENGIGKTTLTVVCNDSNGFAIYAIGYTDNKYEGDDHTKLIGQNTNSAIDTAVYTNNTTPSNWSMKVNKVTDSTVSYNPQNMSILNSFDSWHIVPSTYTKVAQYHASTGSSTTDSTLGAKVETTYAAYIAQNQPADTYIGQVKYTMVHPYTEQPLQPQTTQAGCIRYYPNGSNVVGTMGCQSISNTDTSATLLASNFSRTGYGFAGWSNKFDYATNTDPDLRFYGPQEDITFIAGQYTGSNNGLSLYAVWVKSAGNLQDATKVAQLCGTGTDSLIAAPSNGTANLKSVSALTDLRDNQTYAIAKLADGNCWMIENLRLESTAEHNDDGIFAQGYGASSTYGNFRGLADAEISSFGNTTTANSLYYSGTQSGTASINIGTTDVPEYRMPRYNNTNTSIRISNPAANNTTMYSYGNYYTWHAAVANTAHYVNDADSTTSICPSGWRLPMGTQTTTNKSFSALSVALGGPEGGAFANSSSIPTGKVLYNTFRSYPNNFLTSGYYESIRAYNMGASGRYWSSTSYGAMNGLSWFFELESNGVGSTASQFTTYLGFSLRCVVDS